MRSIQVSTALLAFALLGCGERPDAVTEAGETGGTLVIATPNATTPTIAPLAGDVMTRAIADQLYERLADMPANMNTVGDAGYTPRLAQRWAWAADSLSIAFSLDPDARWHDGRPVRASDVRFSLAMLKDPKTPTAFAALLGNVDSVSVRDSLTAVAWFHRRTPEQFYDLVYNVVIVPEHVLAGIPRDQLATADFTGKLIGSGPFRLARSEPGVRVELVADTANYRGRAKLDRVVWTRVADPSAGITQLLSGQVDLFENIPANTVPQVDSSPHARVLRYPQLAYAYLGMNLRDPRRPAIAHPVFGDRNVRRAISMALDRQSMLRNVFDSMGVLSRGPFPRAIADTTVRLLPFDRAAAAALLDSVGWRPGPDGVRRRDGRPLGFRLMVPTSSSQRMAYAVLIQEQLKAVGVRVEIDPLEFTAFNQRQGTRAFDAALMAFGTDPSIGGAKQSWSTGAMGGGGQNFLSYSSPAFDAAVDSALATFDAGRARQYAHRAYQTLVDDAPAVWLYDVLGVNGVHERLRTPEMSADGWWARLADWWIPAGERIERDRVGLRAAQP
jgi:peptide/nickel transport system substrate-binding protein